MSEFIKGRTYYRLTFADPKLTMPSLEPMVFIGLDIFPEKTEASGTHYFQDTVSYWRFGVAHEVAAAEDIRLYPCERGELGDMHSLSSAAAEIESALARSRELGEPTLREGRQG